ncbi:MAG: hypothetical protein KGI00_04915, partial [Candidatus Micrarchaeota archaeon]|nr:hypothetical protein [Candidatus Micrarchaeota archaeon]
MDGLGTSVRYRGSQVAVVYGDYATVSSCGWETRTTKAVINAVLEAADTSVRIVQRKFDWYLVGTHEWDGPQFAASFTPYDYH